MYYCSTCKQYVNQNTTHVCNGGLTYYQPYYFPDTTQSAEVIRQLLKRIADLEARLDQKK